MNTKSIAIIIVAAVVIVAVSAIAWQTSQNGEDEFRQSEVGDMFLYEVIANDPSNGEAEGLYYYYEYVYEEIDGVRSLNGVMSGEDRFKTYSDYDIDLDQEPAKTGTVEFMGMSAECNAYIQEYDTDTWTYWVDPRTDVFVKIECVTDYSTYICTYTFTLIESTVYGGTIDIDVNTQETEVEPGDVVSYLANTYSDGVLTSSRTYSKAVTAVGDGEVTYSIVGTDAYETMTVEEFLHSDGYRGLEPSGTAYVMTIDYGNMLCDVYIEDHGDGAYDKTYIGRDDGVMYLRYECNSSGYTEYSLLYSSLVIGSGANEIVPADDPFGYTVTTVEYRLTDGVPTYSVEMDHEVYCIYEDGRMLTSSYEDMVYVGDSEGTPWFIEFQTVTGEAADKRTVNTPWGALECEAVSFEDEGVQYTVYRHGGVVVALLAEDGTESVYTIVTYSGYDWGRDDPFPSCELRDTIEAGDWCMYYADDASVLIQVTGVNDDGTITVLNDGEEESWTVEGLLKGPGYENGEYVCEMSCDFMYGTRYCDVYTCTLDDGTVYTSYIGKDDGILYGLGVERNGSSTVYELYWASYVL